MNSTCQTNIVIQRKEKDITFGNHNEPIRLVASDSINFEDDFGMKLKRRTQPKSKQDISVLRRELKHWNTKQLSLIERTQEDSSHEISKKRKQQLDTEIKLKRTISHLEQKVNFNDATKHLDEYLQSITKQTQWTLSDGSFIQIETPKSLHIQKVVEIYHSLIASSKKGPPSSRIPILEEAMNICSTFSTPISKELLELLRREKDFLIRDITSSLTGLRKRIMNLYVKFIKEIQNQ